MQLWDGFPSPLPLGPQAQHINMFPNIQNKLLASTSLSIHLKVFIHLNPRVPLGHLHIMEVSSPINAGPMI